MTVNKFLSALFPYRDDEIHPTTTTTTAPLTVAAPITIIGKESNEQEGLQSTSTDTKVGTYLRHPKAPPSSSSSQSNEIPNLVTGFDQLKQKISSNGMTLQMPFRHWTPQRTWEASPPQSQANPLMTCTSLLERTVPMTEEIHRINQ